MSGGSYDYVFRFIHDMSGDHRLIGGSPLRRAFAKHLELVAKAMHDVEWVDSCDNSPGFEDAAIKAVLGEGAELKELIVMGEEVRNSLDSALKDAYGHV